MTVAWALLGAGYESARLDHRRNPELCRAAAAPPERWPFLPDRPALCGIINALKMGIDWSRAKKGGKATGKNPTDRGKPGTEHHLAVNRRGIPRAVSLAGATAHGQRSGTLEASHRDFLDFDCGLICRRFLQRRD